MEGKAMIQAEDIEPDRKKWDHSNEGPIVVTCSNCGSGGVTRDATVRWDIQSQTWQLSGIFDNGDCDICGQSRLEDTPVTEFFGDMYGREQLPLEGISVMAVDLGKRPDKVGASAWKGETQLWVSPKPYGSVAEAKDAARQWLLENGHL
jgi:hypothetical protein